MLFKKVKINYSKGYLTQIRFLDYPLIQYEQTPNHKLKKITFPLLRKPKTDKPVFYLKVNSKSYNYSIFSLAHWLYIVNAMKADYYILCDDEKLEYEILKRISFCNENIKFINSDRRLFKKVIKNTCTPNWEKAGYAHLTTYIHAKKYGIKEIWNIDADDTIFFETPAAVAKVLEKVENYARNNNYHSFSLDMHRSAFRGLQWTFGITFTRMNIDIEKTIVNNAQNKDWQIEYHHNVLNLPINKWESNLDAYFTYLKDKQILNLGTFNINNLYFIHWGNCFIQFLLRSVQITKGDNIMYYPFYSSVDSEKSGIPVFDDVINLDAGVDEQSSRKFMNEILFGFDKRIEAVRDNYDKNVKLSYEKNKPILTECVCQEKNCKIKAGGKMKISDKIFSVKKYDLYKEITFFFIKFKVARAVKISDAIMQLKKDLIPQDDWKRFNKGEDIDNTFMNMNIKINSLTAPDTFDPEKIFNTKTRPFNMAFLDSNISYIEYLFPNLKGTFRNDRPLEQNPDFFYTCGISTSLWATHIISEAMKHNEKAYIMEDCFLRSIFSYVYKDRVEDKYHKSIGFTIDDITHYVDCSTASRLELMLNDKNLIISDEQKQRARKCMDKILETHLSKYNNQPIFEPEIGRQGVPKVLVVDQSFGDWSILKGGGSEEIFKIMLEKAIKENPDADIIVKTHPDTMSGTRGGYYTSLKSHDNVYTMTEPINPISLVKYCDKVYVCTTQLGMEALICGKEVHTFGIPFYSGWGLTIDYQDCERRTNKRSVEELFYIAYIMYSHYVNPDKKSGCEIEEAMDYLLRLRDEYFSKHNN